MQSKKKILLVEDDIFIQDLYRIKFDQEGFEIVCAGDGVEALRKLENFCPDAILLDVIMPRMGGIETLHKLKAEKKWQEVPVVMLTNIAEERHMQEAQEIGVNDYIIKAHFSPAEVVEKIRTLLDWQNLV